jgi:hypothetical protein
MEVRDRVIWCFVVVAKLFFDLGFIVCAPLRTTHRTQLEPTSMNRWYLEKLNQYRPITRINMSSCLDQTPFSAKYHRIDRV